MDVDATAVVTAKVSPSVSTGEPVKESADVPSVDVDESHSSQEGAEGGSKGGKGKRGKKGGKAAAAAEASAAAVKGGRVTRNMARQRACDDDDTAVAVSV